MGKYVLATGFGVLVGVLATLGVQRQQRRPLQDEAGRAHRVLEVVPLVMKQALPGSRVLDVSLETPSTASVNYEHDALYDVHVTYELSDEVREITLPFGFSGTTQVMPRISDIVIANDKAVVVQRLKASGRREGQPN